MNPARSGGEISYAVLEVIYDDRKVRQSAVHKCHAQLPCKCLARYQARPCLALRTALVHGKIPKPFKNVFGWRLDSFGAPLLIERPVDYK